MEQNPILEQLVAQGAVWRGRYNPAAGQLPTGWTALDRLLGGGWPRGALIELLHDGVTGLGLLLPALRQLDGEGGWLAWINPPYLPYAPALAARGLVLAHSLLIRTDADQAPWAAEQTLRSGTCGAVLSWPGRLRGAQVRRLQLAAEAGNALGVLFRPLADRPQNSAAALRLQVEPEPGALRLRLLKRRGGWGGAELRLPT
jgi:cell division inhibitor SulA